MTAERADLPDSVVVTESARAAGVAVTRLCAVMNALRSPGGCAWDATQTHSSLVEYLVEETYEVIDAIDSADDDSLREELGDLLLQVVFHSRLAEERSTGAWGLAEVADGITAKLIRRHPHVFAADDAPDAASAEASWQARKAREKGRASAMDGIPLSMPSLPLAAKLTRRAVRAGSVVPVGGPQAQAAADRILTDPAGPEPGEFLLALAARCAAEGIDLDQELRRAVRAYRDRVVAAEAVEAGDELPDPNLDG